MSAFEIHFVAIGQRIVDGWIATLFKYVNEQGMPQRYFGGEGEPVYTTSEVYDTEEEAVADAVAKVGVGP